MSFRIDDILKKDNSSSKITKIDETKCSVVEDSHSAKQDWKTPTSTQSHCSILQQTLQNKPHFSYFPLTECSSVKYCSSLYNCDMLLPFSSLDPCIDRGTSYTTLYPRTRFWPTYPTLSTLFPLSYSHYSKRKGGQVRFTTAQTEALEKRFNTHKYLSPEDRRILANTLKLTDRQVKTWFQNRRAKWRRCNSISSNSSETKASYQEDSDNESEVINTSRSASPMVLSRDQRN